jgi:hypothetical protein
MSSERHGTADRTVASLIVSAMGRHRDLYSRWPTLIVMDDEFAGQVVQSEQMSGAHAMVLGPVNSAGYPTLERVCHVPVLVTDRRVGWVEKTTLIMLPGAALRKDTT